MNAPTPNREQLRSRRKREVRAVTESTKRFTKRRIEQIRAETDYPEDVERPRRRGDCAGVPRPCPFVSCRHHLAIDVSPRTGALKRNFPDLEVWEMPPGASCALDVADRGEATLEEVGEILNITRERARQLENRALLSILRQAEVFDEAPHEALPDNSRHNVVRDASLRTLEALEVEPCTLWEVAERVYGAADIRHRNRARGVLSALVKDGKVVRLDDGRFALGEE